MSAPRLSICIATLNRAAFIGATIESIAPQLTDQVELVILDGASKDETEQVVQGYARRYPPLRYLRQAKNQGVDRDYDLAVQEARGEYCWLMTDDDLLKPGAVATVLEALRPQPSLVIVNAEVRSLDLGEVLEPGRLTFTDRRSYGPHELSRLFGDIGAYVTFIGCVIVRRSLWLERQREPYFGTLFIHVGVLFQAELPAGALVLPEILISIRYGNAMWRPREFEIWMFKWPQLVWGFDCLSPEAKRAVCPEEPWREFKRLFFFRAKGAYSTEEFRRWISPRLEGDRLGLKARVAAAVPGPLANAMVMLYLNTVARDQGRWRVDARGSRFHYRNLLKWRPGAAPK